jgi:hypothetical protein
MNARNTILGLAVGATLVLGASSANARELGQTRSAHANLAVSNLYRQAISKFDREDLPTRAHSLTDTRPDDRGGVRGA